MVMRCSLTIFLHSTVWLVATPYFAPSEAFVPKSAPLRRVSATRGPSLTHSRITSSWRRNSDENKLAVSVPLAATAVNSSNSHSASNESNKYRLTAALAFMTGFADVCLIRKYQTFATMMTGNSMWLMLAVSEGRLDGVIYYISIILSYMAGLAIFRKAEMKWSESSLSRFVAPIVGLLFLSADYWSYRYPAIRWPASNALACAYGMINSVGTEMAGTLAFVVTGHLSKLAHSLTDRFSRQAGRKKLNMKTMVQSNIVFWGFCLGALGAFEGIRQFPLLLSQYGAFSIMGFVYSILFFWQDRSSLNAWWRRKGDDYCELDEYDATCN